MDNSLTDKEKRFLELMYKTNKVSYYCIATVLLLLISISHCILGISLHNQTYFLIAFLFFAFSFALVMKGYTDSKLIKIIKKLLSQGE